MRNIYRKSVKSLFINQFCEDENDIHEYGDVWKIDITKKSGCQCNRASNKLPSKNVEDRRRTPEAIRGCCNTCSTLAVGAGACCARISHYACATVCLLFVETIRQICEDCCFHGGWDDRCWEDFSFWKDTFRDEHPRCPDLNEGMM